LEEDYSEKKALLQEITDMIADAKHTAETIEDSVRKKTEEEVIQAQKIRKASLETLQNGKFYFMVTTNFTSISHCH